MLVDEIVNYMSEKCRKIYNLETATLKEKTIADNKIRFKFERNGLKLQVEFGNDDISNIIYNNFLTENQTENVTYGEFREKMQDYIESTVIDSKEKLDTIVLKIIEDVRSSKLFGGNKD